MPSTGDRSQYFPAIERKHGRPVTDFLDLLGELESTKYDEQMALLQEGHGFSRAHANAVVMYHRGSTTSRRHDGPEAWFAALDDTKQRTARAVFAAITTQFSDLDLVVAWNQPMLKSDNDYVFGLSASTNHLTLNPMSRTPIAEFGVDLTGYRTNKFTFAIPVDWDVDADLLHRIVAARLAELSTE